MELQGETCRSGGGWAPPKAHQTSKKLPITAKKKHIFPCGFIKSQAFSFVFFFFEARNKPEVFRAFWVVTTYPIYNFEYFFPFLKPIFVFLQKLKHRVTGTAHTNPILGPVVLQGPKGY